MKQILSGNEAIARGAYEAGVRLACAYPGTPSTEILESVAGYPEIYSEWTPNEKVAMEVGLGSSLAGARTLVCMKHVGVNVAPTLSSPLHIREWREAWSWFLPMTRTSTAHRMNRTIGTMRG